jgi:hypothetical protein
MVSSAHDTKQALPDYSGVHVRLMTISTETTLDCFKPAQ